MFLVILIPGFLVLAGLVNFLGALAPELGFDALWYHLTIAKLYVVHGGIYHIPGGLLYYSEMPRLMELLYALGIWLAPGRGEIVAHLLDWGLGVGAGIVTYLVARKFVDKKLSFLAALIFYATPLVDWQSGSAYIDLPRTFFEVAAVYFLLTRKPVWSGIFVGLALATKTLAWGSLGVVLICWLVVAKQKVKDMIFFLLPAVVIALPWVLSAYLTTGYPFYPLGAGGLDPSHNLVFWHDFVTSYGLGPIMDLWKISLLPDDLLTPIYLIFLPFFLWQLPKLWRRSQELVLYVICSYAVWWLTPRTGGGRFILPYLPVWAVVTVVTLTEIKDRLIVKTLILCILVVAIINIGYRVGAQKREVPYLLGRETATQYLCQNLDFHTAVFVDCDGWFGSHIGKNDLALISGLHNLYYVDFPFVHETWYRGEPVDYLVTDSKTATSTGRLVHYNQRTGIAAYKL